MLEKGQFLITGQHPRLHHHRAALRAADITIGLVQVTSQVVLQAVVHLTIVEKRNRRKPSKGTNPNYSSKSNLEKVVMVPFFSINESQSSGFI